MSKIKYCSDLDLAVVKENCKERKWKKVDSEGDWNLYWSALPTVKNYFKGPYHVCTLRDHQLINHFPTYSQLSSKDTLVKNIQNYRKDLEKKGSPCAQKDSNGNFTFLGFIPVTFSLPQEFDRLKKYFKKNPHMTWILKPCERSLGIGIFLINKISQLERWTDNPRAYTGKSGSVNYVASRYIDNPLLIGGKKFDLRLYVLVLSFKPLVTYFYKLGFCRFCQLKYSNDPDQIENLHAHLTNVSIQYLGEKYKTPHGGKWSIKNLRLYLEGTKNQELADKLFDDIRFLIVHSLKATAPHMTQDPHCFECYGYDILISDDYKPWLIEVNALPSLVPTTEKDRVLKHRLLNDIINIVLPDDRVPDITKPLDKPAETKLGNFELICDERREEVKADKQK